MIAFEIQLNGKRLYTAGIDGDGVLSASLSHIQGPKINDLFFDVGGLNSVSEEHLRWREPRQLKVGDNLSLKIVETDVADKPRERYQFDSKEDRKRRKAYVRAQAKTLGWKIVTRPASPKRASSR